MKELFSTQVNNKKEKCDVGPENSIYDTAPLLTLKERKADVSYYYNDVLFGRETSIYEDQNKNNWYEVKKSPRKQMMVSLLAQPLFNISTVIEVPQKEVRSVSKFFSKINPKLSSIYNATADVVGKSSPVFLSKELNLDKVEHKDYKENVADYLAFESIFDSAADSDRSFLKDHNIRLGKGGYALFDFDNSGVIPLEHFNEWKESQDKIGGTAYLPMAKEILSDCFPKPVDDKFTIEKLSELTEVYKSIFNKLTDTKDFFDGTEGEKFVEAVLKKTKYEEEYKTNNKKNQIDESYINSHELTQGLLAQIRYNLQGLQNELRKNRDWLIAQINSKDALKTAKEDYEARYFYAEKYQKDKPGYKDWSSCQSLDDEEFKKRGTETMRQYDELILEIEKIINN